MEVPDYGAKVSKPGKETENTSLKPYDAAIYDYNAEAGVLSALLLENTRNSINEVREEYFHNDLNRTIFKTIMQMYDDGMQIDVISLHSRLAVGASKERLLLQLNDISDYVLDNSAFANHLSIIREKYHYRALINTFNAATEQIRNNVSTNTIAYGITESVVAMQKNSMETSIIAVDEANKKVMNMVEDVLGDQQHMAKTWFGELDRLTSTLGNKALIILGGRPGMGKSVLAMCIILNNIINNVPCGLINYEMSTEDTTLRMLSNVARQPYTTLIRTVNKKDEDKVDKMLASLMSTMDRISGMPFYQEDAPRGDLSDLMTVMTKMVMIHGCRLIFVDYLQLISATGKGDNKSIEIGVITRALKMFAKNYGVDVVLLSQLNRSLETRTDKRPKLSDLRESGNIEQDADLVMFVYRDEYYNENTTTPGIMEIIVAKNRHGKTGTVSLYYQEEISMIASLSRDEE